MKNGELISLLMQFDPEIEVEAVDEVYGSMEINEVKPSTSLGNEILIIS